MSDLSERVFVVVSNVAFIPAIFLSLWYKRLAESVYLSIILAISTQYHMCLSQFSCIFDLTTSRNADNYFVYTFLVWIVLYWIDFKFEWRFSIWIITTSILYTTIIVYMDTWTFIGIFGGSLAGIAIFLIMFETKRLPAFNIWLLIILLMLIAGAIYLFIYGGDINSSTYPLAHSFWHILIAFAAFIVIFMKENCKPIKIKRFYY